MGDFKISGKNVITQAGTAEPVLASNVTLGTGIITPANIQDAATSTLSCTTNSTITVTTADTSTLSIGMAVSGTGIPAGATIVTVPNSTSFTLSAAATASATNTLTFQKGIVASKIEDDAVTYAKMQNLGTANRVLGSSSTGVIGEVQIATAMVADDAVTSAKLDTNIAVAGTLGVTGAATLSSTLAVTGTTTTTGLLTTTGGIEDQTLKDAKIGASYYHFDKVNDEIRIGHVMHWSYDDLSIFSWIRTTSTDSSVGYAGNAANCILGDHHGTVISSFGVHGGVLKVFKWNSGWTSVASTSSVNDGEWHHVGFTWEASSGQVKFYIDGALDNTTTLATGLYGFAYSVIGAGYSNGTVSGDFFDGDIASVRTYNKLLTATEVKGEYNGLPVPFVNKSIGGFRQNIMSGMGNMESWGGGSAHDHTSWAQNNTHYKAGNYAGLLQGTSGNTRIQTNNISLDVGKLYKATAWVYWNGTGTGVELRRSSGGWTNMANTTTSGEWVKLSATFTAPDALDYMSVWIPGSGTTKQVWIDEFSIVPVGTIVDYTGSSALKSRWLDTSGSDNPGHTTTATLVSNNNINSPALAWLNCNAGQTIVSSFGIRSIGDNGTGKYTCSPTKSASWLSRNGNVGCVVSGVSDNLDGGSAYAHRVVEAYISSNGDRVDTVIANESGTLSDASGWFIAVFGD